MDATKVQIIIGEYAKLEFGSKRITKKKTYDLIRSVVEEELILLNQKYLEIKLANHTNKKFGDQQAKAFLKQNEDLYGSDPFRSFIKFSGKKHTEYYDRMLNDCLISQDTFEDFLSGINEPQSKTLDFFNAFTRFVEREHSELINLEPKKLKIDVDKKYEKTKSETNELDLDYILNHPISYAEELIDAFELGLNCFFSNFIQELIKKETKNDEKDVASVIESFNTFLESWNLKGVISTHAQDIIYSVKRLNAKKDSKYFFRFEKQQVQGLFLTGWFLAKRIHNRLLVETNGDSVELKHSRIEIDKDLMINSAYLDLEFIYDQTFENYHNIDPNVFIIYVSQLKGELRKRYSKITNTTDNKREVKSLIYMFGFELKLLSIIGSDHHIFGSSFEYIISNFLNENSVRFLIHSNFDSNIDNELIRKVIFTSSLRDYYRLGELMAMEILFYSIYMMRYNIIVHKKLPYFHKNRDVVALEYHFKMLDIYDIYEKFMPKYTFDKEGLKADKDLNILIIKLLNRLQLI